LNNYSHVTKLQKKAHTAVVIFK